MKFSAIVEGRRIELTFKKEGTTNLEAEVDGRRYTLQSSLVQPGVYWFNVENRSIELTVTPTNESYTVSVGGREVPVEILDARAALKQAARKAFDGVVEVRAPMPGKIVKLLVAAGAEVHAQQGLLVMEAMKMQNEIKAPKKGIVRKLVAVEGMAVSSGDLLASVE